MDMNHFHIIGRLTKNVELKYTPSGVCVASFSVAVDDSYKKNGQRVDQVYFFNCSLFGKLAEVLNQYLLKGKQIAASGKLRQETWESGGVKHSTVKLIVDNIQMLAGATGQKTATQKPAIQQSEVDDFEDDIPF